MAAFQILRRAYLTDVSPVLAMARMGAGGAIDPIAAYRASGYRANAARKRRSAGTHPGIV
jgi:L-rhamnose isomerase/sugar isomerase